MLARTNTLWPLTMGKHSSRPSFAQQVRPRTRLHGPTCVWTDLQKREVITGHDCEWVSESVGASYKVDLSNTMRTRCCRNFSRYKLGREKNQKDVLACSLLAMESTRGCLSKNVALNLLNKNTSVK